MSDSSQMSWSDNPYAPKIPYPVYLSEKSNFAGVFIGAILYGVYSDPRSRLSVLNFPVRSS